MPGRASSPHLKHSVRGVPEVLRNPVTMHLPARERPENQQVERSGQKVRRFAELSHSFPSLDDGKDRRSVWYLSRPIDRRWDDVDEARALPCGGVGDKARRMRSAQHCAHRIRHAPKLQDPLRVRLNARLSTT